MKTIEFIISSLQLVGVALVFVELKVLNKAMKPKQQVFKGVIK